MQRNMAVKGKCRLLILILYIQHGNVIYNVRFYRKDKNVINNTKERNAGMLKYLECN